MAWHFTLHLHQLHLITNLLMLEPTHLNHATLMSHMKPWARGPTQKVSCIPSRNFAIGTRAEEPSLCQCGNCTFMSLHLLGLRFTNLAQVSTCAFQGYRSTCWKMRLVHPAKLNTHPYPDPHPQRCSWAKDSTDFALLWMQPANSAIKGTDENWYRIPRSSYSW